MANGVEPEIGQEVSLEQLEPLITSGQYQVPSGVTVPILSPRGEPKAVDGSNLAAALEAGYKVENPISSAARDIVDSEGGLGGASRQLFRSFINQLALGIPGQIEEAYQSPLDAEVNKVREEKYRIPQALGGTAGFVGSLAALSPAVKAVSGVAKTVGSTARGALGGVSPKLAESFVGRAAENAAKLGVEFGAFSVPQAITEEVLGDSEVVGEALISGIAGSALLGAGLGAAATPVASIVRAVSSRFPKLSAQNLRDKGNKALILSLPGTTRRELNKIADTKTLSFEDVVDVLVDNDLLGGKRILGNADDFVRRFETAVSNTKKNLSSLKSQLDKVGVREFDNRLIQPQLDELAAQWDGPATKSLSREIRRWQQELLQSGANKVPFSKVDDVRSRLGTVIYTPNGQVREGKRHLVPVYKAIRQEYDRAVEAVAGSAKKPGLVEAFKKYNKSATALSRLESAARKAGGAGEGVAISLKDLLSFGGFGGVAGIPGALVGPLITRTIDAHGHYVAGSALRGISEQLVRAGKKIDTGLISALQGKAVEALPALKLRSVDALAEFTGSKGKSRREQFRDAQSDIAEIASTADITAEALGESLDAAFAVVPNATTVAQETFLRGVEYLNREMPKAPDSPNPFFAEQWEPSDQQLSAFERKLQIVLDPLSIINELARGTLTFAHMEAMEAVYPALLSDLRTKVVEIHSLIGKIPYQQRQQVSLFMGGPTDPSMTAASVQRLQQSFEQQDNRRSRKGSRPIELGEQLETPLNKSLRR